MDKTLVKKEPATEPAKVLSPDELAEELMDLAGDCIGWELQDELRDAKRTLEAVQAKMARAGEKKLRILRAKSVEEAKAILDENPLDVNLKLLCQKRPGWKPLQEKGATDEQLKKFLDTKAPGWPEYRPYNGKVIPSAEVGYGGSAQVWVDPDKGPNGNAHLSGQKLLDAVRRVMGIPKPKADEGPKPPAKKTPPKKPAPAARKPAAGKKEPATKPAAPTDDDGDQDEAGGDGDGKARDASAMGVKPEKIEAACVVDKLSIGYATKKVPAVPAFVMQERFWVTGGISYPGAFGGANEATILPLYEPAAFKAKFGAKYDKYPAGSQYAGQRVKAGKKEYLVGPPGESLTLRWPNELAAAKPEAVAPAPPAKPPKPEVKRVSGKTRAQMNAILRQNGPEELERKRALHAPACRSDAPSWEKIAAILDRMYGPAPELASVAALSMPQTPMPTPDDEERDDAGDAKCRVCGCTEDDCSECIEATGGPCFWVDDPIENGDLCSRCKPAEYGRRVSGLLAGGGALASELVITGQGERNGHDCYEAQGPVGTHMWVRKAGAQVATADDVGDPNVDGRGVYVAGVTTVAVRGASALDKAEIVIRVARGADGLYRTGHRLAFRGAQAWQADADEPVRLSGQAVESEAYAIRARANILINLIKAAPGAEGKPGQAWSTQQKAVYGGAIKALEEFIKHNPACQTRPEPAVA